MFGVSSCQEDVETIGVEKGYSVILDESADTKAYVSNDGTVSGTGTYTHGSKVSLSTTSQKIQYRKASTTTWSISTGNTYTIDAIDANYYVRPWTQYYKVTVSGGTGGGDVKAGGSCTINAPANSDPAGKTFEKWTISGTGTISKSANRSTSVTNVGSDCTVTANFKAATVTPTTGTLVVSVLNWFGSDSYLSKIQYKLDGTTYNKTGRWEEPDEFLNTSLSAGSHTLSVVDAGTTVNGARGYKVYFDPSSFTITAGKTNYVNLIITTNE